jgi:hypothetical protein
MVGSKAVRDANCFSGRARRWSQPEFGVWPKTGWIPCDLKKAIAQQPPGHTEHLIDIRDDWHQNVPIGYNDSSITTTDLTPPRTGGPSGRRSLWCPIRITLNRICNMILPNSLRTDN